MDFISFLTKGFPHYYGNLVYKKEMAPEYSFMTTKTEKRLIVASKVIGEMCTLIPFLFTKLSRDTQIHVPSL